MCLFYPIIHHPGLSSISLCDIWIIHSRPIQIKYGPSRPIHIHPIIQVHPIGPCGSSRNVNPMHGHPSTSLIHPAYPLAHVDPGPSHWSIPYPISLDQLAGPSSFIWIIGPFIRPIRPIPLAWNDLDHCPPPWLLRASGGGGVRLGLCVQTYSKTPTLLKCQTCIFFVALLKCATCKICTVLLK